jgi:hypothetical protein
MCHVGGLLSIFLRLQLPHKMRGEECSIEISLCFVWRRLMIIDSGLFGLAYTSTHFSAIFTVANQVTLVTGLFQQYYDIFGPLITRYLFRCQATPFPIPIRSKEMIAIAIQHRSKCTGMIPESAPPFHQVVSGHLTRKA